MNTYIQDKLDEFPYFLGSEEMTNQTKEWVEKALTDYHNHIVEKIEEYANSQTDKTVAMGIIGTISLLKD